jgi:hypothetical protein
MREGGCCDCITYLPLENMGDIDINSPAGQDDNLDLARNTQIYPYYRMSTYEIYGSTDYEVLCGMFLKYYAEKVPVCIAFSPKNKDLLAIWLIGKEAFDPKTKQMPNSEPIGEILWCSDWPDVLKEVEE